MNKTWNGKTLREILRISTPAEFFDWAPPNLIDVIAFCGLAAFCLFPALIALPTLFHCSFDRMVIENMALLDWVIFPFVALCAALAFVLTLGKARYEKRSVLAGIRKSPPLILFVLLLVWMCVNFFCFRRVPGALFHGMVLRHESFSLNLEYYFGFFALGMALRDERMKRRLLRGLTLVSVFLVLCAFYLWKHLTASPLYFDWKPVVACIFTNTNYYGYFLSVVIGLCAALFVTEEDSRWRIFCALALVLNTVVLNFNGTMGAWVGALFACLFLIIAHRVRDGKFERRTFIALGLYLAALTITGLCNGVLNPSNIRRLTSDSGRLFIWSRCLTLILAYPLRGIGFEGLTVYNLIEYAGNSRPHNEFMQYALFYGVPAGIFYTLGCTGVYLRAVRYRARLDNLTLAALAAAFGYLAGSFFGVTVYTTAPFLFVMLGLGYVSAPQKQNFPHDAPERETLPHAPQERNLPHDAPERETSPHDAPQEPLSPREE